ncbi:hypothetical protein [Kocuria rhizophila]|uniref:hypothetical protein n=1 Tax=Kocuria rhizophila TaxID=72000 RepID=UPI00073DAD0A|nr:hypothetical protein [Kocuria rhizophila]
MGTEPPAREDTGGTRPGGRRRGSHRRVTGGTSGDPDRALGSQDWGHTEPELGADAPDPREAVSGSGHETWLREQRPPHWG